MMYPTRYRANPAVNAAFPWNKKDKILRKMANSIAFHQFRGSAPAVLDRLKREDPSANDAKRPYQFLMWLAGVFTKNPQKTMEDLYKVNEFLSVIYEAQKQKKNPPWASRPLTVKRFPSVASLGTYLRKVGALESLTQMTQAEGDEWLETALKLQEQGHARVHQIGRTQWTHDVDGPSSFAFVEVLTDKAACALGAGTKWCTIGGGFIGHGYDEQGLILIYSEKGFGRNVRKAPADDEWTALATGADIVQYTGDLSELMDVNNDPLNWRAVPWNWFHEDAQKWGDKTLKRIGSIYEAQMPEAFNDISGNPNYPFLPIYFTTFTLIQYGLTSQLKWLLANYPNLRLPPLRYILDNTREIWDFFNAKVYTPALYQTFKRIAKHTIASNLAMELCYLQHPVAWKLIQPLLNMKNIPGGKHQFQDFTVDLRPFQMGEFEVTEGVYAYVMGPGRVNHTLQKVSLPMTHVSWYDAVDFCNELSILEGLEPVYQIDGEKVDWDWDANGYRLPTEAEWEAAARARTDFIYAGSNNPDEVAWYYKNSGDRAHPVGGKKRNAYDLYDMSGNVSEWCYDTYHSDPRDKDEHK